MVSRMAVSRMDSSTTIGRPPPLSGAAAWAASAGAESNASTWASSRQLGSRLSFLGVRTTATGEVSSLPRRMSDL